MVSMATATDMFGPAKVRPKSSQRCESTCNGHNLVRTWCGPNFDGSGKGVLGIVVEVHQYEMGQFIVLGIYVISSV